MKKLLFILTIMLTTSQTAFALTDVELEFSNEFQKQVINDDMQHGFNNSLSLLEDNYVDDELTPLEASPEDFLENKPENSIPQPPEIKSETSSPIQEQTTLFGDITQLGKYLYNLKIEDTSTASCLFKNQLTKDFKNGPIDNLHLWGVVQSNFDTMMQEGEHGYTRFNVPIVNVLLDGEFKNRTEGFRIMFDPSHQHNRPFFKQFIQDAYVKTTKIPHHTILFGNSRTGTGFEGAQSPYTLPFINRSQISRNLANVRKIGLRVKGSYDFVDYDLGGYSSDTFFTEFRPGTEVDAWVNFKPLAKLENKGKLTTGGGIVSGNRNSTDYFLSGAYIGYEYKKFWTRMEWAKANGSNGGSGLTCKHREGYYVTLGYRLTKKLELLARYDEFNLDKSKHKNIQREYSAGLNYYIKGQALKLMMNYVFCQHFQRNNSHRLLIGAQLAI